MCSSDLVISPIRLSPGGAAGRRRPSTRRGQSAPPGPRRRGASSAAPPHRETAPSRGPPARFRPALWDNAAVSSGDTAQTAIGPPADPELEPPVGEECGVFGVWAPGEEVSRLTYFGLYALQHRGQEAAGIATTDGSNILVYKDLGLVSQVFDDPSLSNLTGHIAVGHVRYARSRSEERRVGKECRSRW